MQIHPIVVRDALRSYPTDDLELSIAESYGPGKNRALDIRAFGPSGLIADIEIDCTTLWCLYVDIKTLSCKLKEHCALYEGAPEIKLCDELIDALNYAYQRTAEQYQATAV